MSTVQQSTAFPLVHAMLCKNSSPVRFKLVPGPAAARCLSGESHHHTGASFLPGDRARSTLPAAECPLESVVPLAPSACTGLGTKGAIQTRQNTGLWRYHVLQPPQSPSAVTQDMPAHAVTVRNTQFVIWHSTGEPWEVCMNWDCRRSSTSSAAFSDSSATPHCDAGN